MRRWPPYNRVVTDTNGLPMDVQAPRTDLFPEISPYAHGMLKVDGRHTLYWELSGNPRGRAVVFLHGGPGAGTLPVHRRFFDPDHYRIVVFDQRGAGRSTPTADISDNTTAHLIEDMETLRRHLGIERWLVFGGSWGACLAISYGIAYPERCAGFVLRDQQPFDGSVRGGDVTFRRIPNDVDISDLVDTHRSESFDHTGLSSDPNVAFPLNRVRELAESGRLGSLAPTHLSLMGSITAPGRLVRDTAPEAANSLLHDSVDVALLVPV